MSRTLPLRARLLGDIGSPPPANQTDNNGIRVGVSWVLVAMLGLIILQGLAVISSTTWFLRLLAIITGHPPPPSITGLKKKVLDALPKQTFTSQSELKFSECAICLGEFAAGDEIRVLPVCGHVYHVGCIDTWLGKRSSCPLCRELLAGSAAQTGNIVVPLVFVP